MTVRHATTNELRLLSHAVGEHQYVDHLSDGRLRWAFLLDFVSQGAAHVFPGIAGAILLAESGAELPSATLFERADELTHSWRRLLDPAIRKPPGPHGGRPPKVW